MGNYSILSSTWKKLTYWIIFLLFINNLFNLDDQDCRGIKPVNKIESLVEAVLLLFDDSNTLADYDEDMAETKNTRLPIVYEEPIYKDICWVIPKFITINFPFKNNLISVPAPLPDTPPPRYFSSLA